MGKITIVEKIDWEMAVVISPRPAFFSRIRTRLTHTLGHTLAAGMCGRKKGTAAQHCAAVPARL